MTVKRYPIYHIETSFWARCNPYVYIYRNGSPRTYIGRSPLRCARILQITLAMARRYEATIQPARIGQP